MLDPLGHLGPQILRQPAKHLLGQQRIPHRIAPASWPFESMLYLCVESCMGSAQHLCQSKQRAQRQLKFRYIGIQGVYFLDWSEFENLVYGFYTYMVLSYPMLTHTHTDQGAAKPTHPTSVKAPKFPAKWTRITAATNAW